MIKSKEVEEVKAKVIEKIDLSDHTAKLLYQLAKKFYQDDPDREKAFQEWKKQQTTVKPDKRT